MHWVGGGQLFNIRDQILLDQWVPVYLGHILNLASHRVPKAVSVLHTVGVQINMLLKTMILDITVGQKRASNFYVSLSVFL